jgi:imidazole glycerol-phosphate synthase subunit HisH
MIAIVDYRMGNLRSVEKGFEHAGITDVVVTDDAATVGAAEGIVVPGVGAFRDASANLRASGLWDLLLERAAAGVPLLGICLGMQLLGTLGLEDGEHEGLGLVPGVVRRLSEGVKVPHMGWNTVSYPRTSPIFEGVPEDSAFYFVHSYHLVPSQAEDAVGMTEYGEPIVAAVQRGRVFGAQFHPEKSSTLGLRMLAAFGRIVEEVRA